jgi:hypothetical protein
MSEFALEVTMRKCFTIGILGLFLTMSIGVSAYPTQQPDSHEARLDQKIDLDLKNATLMYALSTLSVSHRVPNGIQYAAEDRNEPKLELKGGTLQEILDSIVIQEPLYRWQLVDGVINFVPAGERDPFIETLLNTFVANYDPGKWTIKFQLRDAIGATPEVKKVLESHKMELAKYRDYAYRDSIYTRKDVDLKKSNATVREILNHIIKISEHKGWAIGRRKGEPNVFSIWM